MDFLKEFLASFQQFWAQFQDNVPRVVAAFILFILGWLIARLIEKGASRIFRATRLEEVAEKAGIENFLFRGGVKFTTSTLLARMLYWFFLFFFTLAILNSIGLHSASELLNRMILYIPNVIVAFVVLLFGTLLAKFAHTATSAYLNNIGMKGAEGMSIIVKYAILLFVLSMTFEQLNIGGQVLVSAFQIAFGAFCFGLALAFGLGGKDVAAKILEQFWKNRS